MLDLIASTIKEQAQEKGLEWDELTPQMKWPLSDFVREVLLALPLPSMKDLEHEEKSDWWKKLSKKQKEVVWEALEKEFGFKKKGRREKVEKLVISAHQGPIGVQGEVMKSKKVITAPAKGRWPENSFKPALFFPQGFEPFLSCYVVK